MKKLILFLLICIGIGWYFGDEVASPTTAKERLTSVINTTHATYETLAAEDIPARVMRLYHFKETWENHLHRDRFVPFDRIPLFLKQAIIATEDKRFYEHGPIDFISIGRAFVTNYRAGETREGGSTISQQTVKNILLTNDRSLSRKIEEFLLASCLEREYTKDQILEVYLNTIYYGEGAYGIGDAAQVYFDKNAADLTLAQCAMLAGLPQSPSTVNPVVDYPAAKARQQVVLALMTEQGMITQEMAKTAYNEDLQLRHS